VRCEKCKAVARNGVYSSLLAFYICSDCVKNSGIVGHPMFRVCDDGNRNAKKDWGEESWEELLLRTGGNPSAESQLPPPIDSARRQ
jgi:hypothetical protein